MSDHRTLLLAAVILFTAITLPAQPKPRQSQDEEPRLQLSIHQFPAQHADSVMLWINTRIPLEDLVFLRTDTGFVARFEITVYAENKNDVRYGSRIWEEEISRTDYQETRAPDIYHVSQARIVLAPAEYRVGAQLVDLDNRRRFQAEEKVEARGHAADEVTASDIMLLSEARREPDGRLTIVPSVEDEVSDALDSFYVYLTIWNPLRNVTRGLMSGILKDKLDAVSADYRDSIDVGEVLTEHLLTIATQDLVGRDYTLELTIRVGSAEIERTLPFRILWTGFSHLIDDIEEAVEQARYVASRADLLKMREAEGETQREAFLEFWAGLDPTPDTPRNEIMDEYYRRVAYANANFRSYQPGWQTDLGMVYIVHGPPDDVERHPFEIDRKPYQIWFYYDRGWQFVFIDVNMFGDYRLVTPLYPNR